MVNIKIGDKEYNLDDYRTNYKKKRDSIDNNIDMHKNSLKNIDKSYENMNIIYKKIGECIDILSSSVKGHDADKRYMEMRDNNTTNFKNIKKNYENERQRIVEDLDKIYQQKEKLEKEKKDKKN